MFSFLVLTVAIDSLSTIERSIEEVKAFNELCDSLPKEEADKLREERSKRIESEQQHRRNLEVAREGRSLNFWGNR